MTYKITILCICAGVGFIVGGWVTAVAVACTYLIADNVAVYN